MRDTTAFGLWHQRLPVEPVLEDGFDILKCVGTDGHRSLASLFQPLRTIAFAQAHHAKTRPEALFRMFFAPHDFRNHVLCTRSGFTRPVDDSDGVHSRYFWWDLGMCSGNVE